MKKHKARAFAVAVVALLVLYGPPRAAAAQALENSESPRPADLPGTTTGLPVPAFDLSLKSLGRDFLADAGEIWTYPAHIGKRDAVPLLAVALSAALLIPNDLSIHRGLDSFAIDHDGDDRISPIVSQMGSYGAWGAVGAFLGFGLLSKDPKAVETAALAASAMLQSSLVVRVGKIVTGRLRPFASEGEDDWDGPPGYFRRDETGRVMNYDSFPSGHTATAFSLATVVAMQYGNHSWVPIVAYGVAAAVGASRLTGNKHWVSDVVVGAVLGHVVARLVVRNHRARHRLQPLLAVGPNGVTVGLKWGHNTN